LHTIYFGYYVRW